MLNSVFRICLYVAIFTSLIAEATPAQGQEPGGTIVYENRNQIDPKPLKLHTVSGIATDEDGAHIPGLKIGIFTDGDHALIASASTDQNGRFRLSHIPSGRYRLVVKYPAFCTANVPILIDARSLGKTSPAVELHMKVGGIDVCSFGSLIRKLNPKDH